MIIFGALAPKIIGAKAIGMAQLISKQALNSRDMFNNFQSNDKYGSGDDEILKIK